MGVWIETYYNLINPQSVTSHPAWVCGLKLFADRGGRNQTVTPCVGVWIETDDVAMFRFTKIVTPCVGVWIETLTLAELVKSKGHTLRGCVD